MTKKCSRLLGGCIKGSAADGHYEFMSFIIKGFSQGQARRKQTLESRRDWILPEEFNERKIR